MSLMGHVESGGALLKRAEDIGFVKCEDGMAIVSVLCFLAVSPSYDYKRASCNACAVRGAGTRDT